jgi:hypothetical protein
VLKNKVRSQSAGAILSSLFPSLPPLPSLLRVCDRYATATYTETVSSALFLFPLLLLLEHRLWLVDSPRCHNFKRSSITAIITSTRTNKQPFPIRLLRECKVKLHTCGPLWILFTDLCVFEKGLPWLRWCRGQKSSKTRSETNKKKGGRGKVTSRFKRRHYFAAAVATIPWKLRRGRLP